MYLPIAYMIVFSFNQSKGYSLFTGFTFKWYRSLFTNASILHALWVSVEVAILSAIIATVLGTAASLGIASMSRKSRLLVTNITYIPVVNPGDHHRHLPDAAVRGLPALCRAVCMAAGQHHGPAHAAHCAYRVQRALRYL